MDLRFSPEEEAFRAEARAWLTERLDGDFKSIRGRGGPGDEHELVAERRAWERELGTAGWIGLSWPHEHGGRALPLLHQMIFYEEYARAGGPGRVGIVGEGLLGPTLLHFGSRELQARFLPPILSGDAMWCQGYSEPDAGSDLASVRTRAERDGDEWVVTGTKVWTSLAHWADWCFVLCRTDPGATRHRGLSYVLVPMQQAGIEIHPIDQLTGTSEFNEVVFAGARTEAGNVVGDVGDGWRVAMGTLAFERGASTLGQQLQFENELRNITTVARTNGAAAEPAVRERLARAWIGLRIMRSHALRSLPALERGDTTPATAIHKLYWATFHRELGELAVDVRGPDALVADGAPYELSSAQRLFLFSRADTIYGGSNQIQRNVIGERILGLPREPKVES